MNQELYKLLFEQQEDEDLGDAPEAGVKSDVEPKARKSDDSVDDQIDSLVLMYEKRSIRDEKEDLMESLANSSLRYLLEQEDEPAGDSAGSDEPKSEPEPTTPTGSEEMTAEPAESEPVPDLDIDKFTIKVARLIMNHRNLLNVENAIINRVKNFLDENYGDAFVVRYLDVLDEQFGITVSEFELDYDPDVPLAVGANPAGAGNVGGGG